MEKLKINELESINGGGNKEICDWGMLATSTLASVGYGATFWKCFWTWCRICCWHYRLQANRINEK